MILLRSYHTVLRPTALHACETIAKIGTENIDNNARRKET